MPATERQLATLRDLGYVVEPLDETVTRITGHGLDVTIPNDGAEAEAAWEHYASEERHEQHLAILNAPPEPETVESIDEQIAALQARKAQIAK